MIVGLQNGHVIMDQVAGQLLIEQSSDVPV
jgi:hypothetical protein